MRPDFGIKVALAVLHTLGCDRTHTDGFWKAMRSEYPVTYPTGQAKYARGTNMRTQLEGIMRSLRVGDPLFRHEIHEAVHGSNKQRWTQHTRMLDHLRHEREEQEEKRRKRGDCGWL